MKKEWNLLKIALAEFALDRVLFLTSGAAVFPGFRLVAPEPAIVDTCVGGLRGVRMFTARASRGYLLANSSGLGFPEVTATHSNLANGGD